MNVSYLCTLLISVLLCGIAHAQHSVGKMPVITKCAVTSQKLLIVPGLQKLLEEIIPVQTFIEQFKKPQTQILLTVNYNRALKL